MHFRRRVHFLVNQSSRERWGQGRLSQRDRETQGQQGGEVVMEEGGLGSRGPGWKSRGVELNKHFDCSTALYKLLLQHAVTSKGKAPQSLIFFVCISLRFHISPNDL